MKENLRQNKVTKTNIINGTASRLLIITALLCISFIYSNIKPPAANAAPTGIIKSSEIRPGMRGYGLSVFNGNRIERFPIVVLGRLKNAIGESDMILIKVLGGYPVSHHTGIIAGMSGSPIYIDGRLAGAIGYGWSFSQEPIGGVTPIEHMLGTFPKYQTKALTHKNPDNREYTIEEPVFVGNDKYDRFIIQDIVNQENKSKPGTMVLSPVPSVLQVHGFGKKSLELIRKEFEPYGIMPVSIPGGYKSAYTGQVPHIQPGSPIGVTLVEGDLSIAGTGTVTYRNGDEILAFGHPMLQLGKTDLPLNAARIEAIIPSMNVPFKLSSSLGVVGTLTQDRLYAIAGSLHKKPDMIPMSVAVHDQARNWKKTFNVKMAKQPYFTPLIVSIVGAESLSSSSTNFAGSSGKVEYNLKFKNYPAIKFEDYIAGDFIQSDLYMQVMQYMRYLMTNEFDVPVLEKASMKITVFPDNRTARIQDVSTQYPQVRPGDSIEVAIRLRTLQGENIVKKVKVPIPADLKKGNVKIGVASGRMIRQLNRKMRYSRLTPTNVNQLLNMIRFDTRNNELAVQVMYPKRSIGYAGEKFSNLPGAIISAFASSPRSSVMVMADHYETRVPLDYNIEGIGVIQVGLSNDVPSSPDSASFEGVETEEVTPDDDPAMEEINKPDLLALRSEIVNEYGNVDTIMVAKNKKILHKDIKKNLPTGSFMASIASAHDYFLGNFNRTSITNGNITLAHKMDYPFMSSQPFIMSMIYDSDKNRIVFAESPSGLIMELLDGEAPGVLGRTEEVFLPVMTRDNQGNI
ncbi:MAG: SpoIVB peptidase S55 domain-containing protein, partial [Vulcanimicrobiota bacterium]